MQWRRVSPESIWRIFRLHVASRSSAGCVSSWTSSLHDDQHGTAIVVLAALQRFAVVDKQIADVRIVMSGAGAAGTAVIKLLLAAGARNVVVADIAGVVHRGRNDLTGELEWLAQHTNQLGFTGSLKEAVVGADIFIGVSALACSQGPTWRQWRIGRSSSFGQPRAGD